jgi:AcrR family transcriptional regulator
VVVAAQSGRGINSKGPFYWHFEGRDDLLGATLERWLLVATAGHPLIRSALERATEQRVTYIAGLLRAAGVPRAAAARRATMAYAAYLGHAQMTQATPAALPDTARARRALVDEMTRVLVG